jgi:hypothetical protein
MEKEKERDNYIAIEQLESTRARRKVYKNLTKNREQSHTFGVHFEYIVSCACKILIYLMKRLRCTNSAIVIVNGKIT